MDHSHSSYTRQRRYCIEKHTRHLLSARFIFLHKFSHSQLIGREKKLSAGNLMRSPTHTFPRNTIRSMAFGQLLVRVLPTRYWSSTRWLRHLQLLPLIMTVPTFWISPWSYWRRLFCVLIWPFATSAPSPVSAGR